MTIKKRLLLLLIIISITKANDFLTARKVAVRFAFFFANQRQQQQQLQLVNWVAVALLLLLLLPMTRAYRSMFTVLNSLKLLWECVFCVCLCAYVRVCVSVRMWECVCLVISESWHSLNWHSDLIIHFTLPSNVPITSSSCCCCCRVVLVAVVVVCHCCLSCF